MKVDEKLDKIVDKLELIDRRLDNVDVTLGQQSEQLKHHIYRSDLNEENIEMLRTEAKPVIKAYEQFGGMLKLIGGLAIVAGLVKAVIEISSFFS